MNRSEAFVAMHDGHKVTHQDFTSKEYLHIVNGKVYTEDGYDFEDKFFETDFFQEGWSIYEESDKVVVTSLSYATLMSDNKPRRHKTEVWVDDFVDERPWYNQHGNKRSIFKVKKQMNLKCISHKEYDYTIVVDMNTRKEVELDYEFFPCDCSYPARLDGISCYCESYKCDNCGKSFTVK